MLNLYALPEMSYPRIEELRTPVNWLGFLADISPENHWSQLEIGLRPRESYRTLKRTGVDDGLITRFNFSLPFDSKRLKGIIKKVLEGEQTKEAGYNLSYFCLRDSEDAEVVGNLHKIKVGWKSESSLKPEVYKILCRALSIPICSEYEEVEKHLKKIKDLRRQEEENKAEPLKVPRSTKR